VALKPTSRRDNAMVGTNDAVDKKDERITSFRQSKWQRFDPEFAEMIRTKYPSIWRLGGNIKGNDQFRKLYPITQRGGAANSDMEISALELREAWVARHYEDFRIAGVIAQIKWLAVGSRGEQYMKNLVRERMKAMDEVKHEVTVAEAQDYLEHFGVKGMRWGVRNSKPGGPISAVTGQKVSRKDEKYAVQMWNLAGNKAVRNAVVEKARGGAEKINADPKYKGKDKDGSSARKQYLDAHRKNLEDAFDEVLSEAWSGYQGGKSPSGKFKVSIGMDGDSVYGMTDYLKVSIAD